MKIWIACLAAYNNSKLHGKWVDVTLGADHIREEIKNVLETSPEHNQPYPCEEWAIHDYDGLPSSLGENPNIEELCEMADFIQEHGELGSEVLSYFCGDIKDAIKAMEQDYHGEFKDAEDFAYNWIHEVCGHEVPAFLTHYVNYESMGEDMLINDFYRIEVGNSIHVFSH